MNFKKILFACTLTFSIVLEYYVRHNGIFGIWPPIDNIMHFFWGLNIFLGLVVLLKWKPRDALIGVFVWQMIWELGEMLTDIFIQQPSYMFDHFFFDGIKDTIVDLLGGLLGWLIIAKSNIDGLKEFFDRKTLFVFGMSIGIFTFFGAGASIKYGESQDLFAIYGITISLVIALFFKLKVKHEKRKKSY